jgi:hypothetical protein
VKCRKNWSDGSKGVSERGSGAKGEGGLDPWHVGNRYGRSECLRRIVARHPLRSLCQSGRVNSHALTIDGAFEFGAGCFRGYGFPAVRDEHASQILHDRHSALCKRKLSLSDSHPSRRFSLSHEIRASAVPVCQGRQSLEYKSVASTLGWLPAPLQHCFEAGFT